VNSSDERVQSPLPITSVAGGNTHHGYAARVSEYHARKCQCHQINTISKISTFAKMKTRHPSKSASRFLLWVGCFALFSLAFCKSEAQTVNTFSAVPPGPNTEPAQITITFQFWDASTSKWDFTITGIPAIGYDFTNKVNEPLTPDWRSSLGDSNPAGEAPALAPYTLQGGTFGFNTGFVNGGPTLFGNIPGAPAPIFQQVDWNRLLQDTQGGAVQLATGAEASKRPLFSFKGARSWSFGLGYNSLLARSLFGGFPLAMTFSAPMAVGWSHDFQAAIAQSGNNLVVYWDQYRYNTFTPSPGNPNQYTSTDDATRYDTIAFQSAGGWLLTHRDQSSLLFNASGLLVEDRDPNGHKLVLAYTPTLVFVGGASNGVTINQLTSISDPISATSLSMTYDPASYLLTKLTDSTGATVQLQYLVQNNLNVLSRIIDQDGRVSTFTYDSNFQFATLTDGTGAILTQNTNDSSNGYRVTSQTDARNGACSFAYSASNGQLMTVYTDRNRFHDTYVFDSNFNELSVTDPLSETTNYTYDSSNRVTSVTDPLSRTTSYAYDGQGNLLTSTDQLGKVTQFTYDSLNNLLTVTDPLGQETKRTYDLNNNLLTVTDALNHTTTWTYDANSLPLTMILPRGGVYTYSYAAGYLIQARDPKGVVTTFGYDADGRILYRQDSLGNRITYAYDAVGNLLSTTNALNQAVRYICDNHNRVTSVTDPLGAVTAFTYDGDDNRTSVTDALGHVTTYSYDRENRLLTIVDPLSLSTTFAYDSAGRLITVQDPLLHVTTYQYDAAGQTIAVIDPLNNSTTKGYDVRGLLSAITDPLGRTTNFGYDTLWRKTTAIDPLSRQTTFSYDPLSRLTQVTDPGNLNGSQAYDSDGNRMSLTNPSANATAFTFDAAERMTSTATPEGNTTSYTYDPRGLPLTVTQPSTSATSLSYDGAMRLSSYTDPVGTVAFARDADGRVLTSSENGKTLTRVYDLMGRLTSYTDGAGNAFVYQYDADGRLTQLTYPGGKIVTYAYDGASRLSTVTDWANRVTTYSYDNDGRVIRIQRPNGSVQTLTYDSAGQLTQLTDLEAFQGTIIYSGSYGYDLAGQLTGETLTPAPVPTVPNVSLTVDTDNRLLTFNGSSVTHDPNGNLLSVASGIAPASYAYDARNRLISAGGLTYGYNSENRRTAITSSTGATNFAINPNANLDQVLIKTGPDGAQTFYVYGLGLLNEETNGIATYYHFDRLGNTVALTNASAGIAVQVSYGSFGEIVSQTGTVTTPFLFNGRWGVQTDSNGIYYHRARYYHPGLRRFLNQDTVLGSIGVSASMNRFAYANGNPISGIDPFGMMQMDAAPNSAGSNSVTTGIFYANHPVALGMSHSKIVIVPTDQAKYANDPRFQNTNGNGLLFATVGAGPDHGLLPGWDPLDKSGGGWMIAGIDRPRDVSEPANNGQSLGVPSQYGKEDAAIAAVFNAVDAYKANGPVQYVLFGGSDGNYNSNGFVSGILQATGFQVPADHGGFTPGFDNPVPARYFDPKK
jgi:RHS repeat-associated protein